MDTSATKGLEQRKEHVADTPRRILPPRHKNNTQDIKQTGMMHARDTELPRPVQDDGEERWVAPGAEPLFTPPAAEAVASWRPRSTRNWVISCTAVLGVERLRCPQCAVVIEPCCCECRRRSHLCAGRYGRGVLGKK